MTDFIAKLDEYTTEFLTEDFPAVVSKLFGFTELVRNTTENPAQPFPVVINGTGDRSDVRVSLDDDYEFISWFRVPGRIESFASEEDNWGLKEGRKMRVTLRWVIAHRVELGEELIIDLVSSIPVNLRNIGVFQYVFVDPDITVDADHEAVYNTELGNTEYEKHRLDWNIYAVEITCEFMSCPGVVIRITEDNQTRITQGDAVRILE